MHCTHSSGIWCRRFVFMASVVGVAMPLQSTAQEITDGQVTHYRWLKASDQPTGAIGRDTIESRFSPPSGATRRAVREGSFAAWLRGLPLHPPGSAVHLFNGRLKPQQDLHEAVIRIDVGTRDLQQCADAVIRLRAEYLYSQDRHAEITFNYTTGDPIPFSRWAKGERPRVRSYQRKGKRRWRVDWQHSSRPSYTHENLQRYLTNVFMYAGTASLSQELKRRRPSAVQIGDLYLQGGHPGHAVLIVDLAEHPVYGTIAMLAQSYMPAQEPHILKNIFNPDISPWFQVAPNGRMYTPEWNFNADEIYHF